MLFSLRQAFVRLATEYKMPASSLSANALSHVIVLNDFLHVQGGASRVAVDEAVALAQAGLDVTFVGAKGPACSELVHGGVHIVNLDQPELIDVGKSPSVILQQFWNAKAHREVDDLLASLDPSRTIVHLHSFSKALTVAPVRPAVRRGFPVVCTLHDFFLACPNGGFFDYNRNMPCGHAALSIRCMATNCDKRSRAHKVFRVARGLAQRHIAGFPANVNEYIALSKRSAEVVKPYLRPDARISFLGNIVPVARLPAVDVGTNTTIVAVGRLDREKGIEILLAAARASGVSITFIGDGPMRALVERTPRMTVTGWRTATEVSEMLTQARALVFPSLWYETFGLVVSEAAAKGVPAIVTDVSAAAERVEHGRTGWVVPAGDVASLAAALGELANSDLVIERGKAAYDEFWTNPPDTEHHTAELLAIYRRTLDRKSIVANATPATIHEAAPDRI